ncbi:unnamed protein product [Mytilus edulis]|uniref:Uncharacterized protein n=1 Tax=Mytilus edulis TaxID=6550 RepID=A0A8S3UXS7_MYTED|nr:unnamed protein product [Mytilus edulis]
MTQKQLENFYRTSRLIFEHGKDVLVLLLDDDLSKRNITLIDFINLNQHEIYHLCYHEDPCCRCTRGKLSRNIPSQRVLFPCHLDILFDKTSKQISGHNLNSKSKLCCSSAKQSLTAACLDFTLLTCLLMNFTSTCTGAFRKNVKDLLKYKNNLHGHSQEGIISDADYSIYKIQIESVILSIAKQYNKERMIRQKLKETAVRAMDDTVYIEYRNTLLHETPCEKGMKKRKAYQTSQNHIGKLIMAGRCEEASDSLTFYNYLCEKIGSEEVVKIRRVTFLIYDIGQSDNFISSGSKAEGLNLIGSDTDVMIVDSEMKAYESETDVIIDFKVTPFIMNTDDTQPCFTQLYAPIDIQNYTLEASESFLNMSQQNHLGYLLSNEKYKLFKMSNFGAENNSKIHGPCISDGDNEYDCAYCLKCDTWISQAKPWHNSSIVPKELQQDVQNGDTIFHPLPYSHFLNFLCHYHRHDITSSRQSLKQLIQVEWIISDSHNFFPVLMAYIPLLCAE